MGKWYFKYQQWGLENKHLEGSAFIDENSPELLPALEFLDKHPDHRSDELKYFKWIPDVGEKE